jgi:hypothetical protein
MMEVFEHLQIHYGGVGTPPKSFWVFEPPAPTGILGVLEHPRGIQEVLEHPQRRSVQMFQCPKAHSGDVV